MMGLPGALVFKGRRHEDREEGTGRLLLESFQPDPRQMWMLRLKGMNAAGRTQPV